MGSGVSVVIPALNEAESIGVVVESMPWGSIDECVVVDNGSTDATGAVAAAAGARVVKAARGYGSAMMAGVAASGGEVLVFMDGDGADDITEFDRIAGPVLRGEADFVIGSRIRGSGSGGRCWGARCLRRILLARW